jgi:(p)ppGpp synthase/HD superfamily hydrolase
MADLGEAVLLAVKAHYGQRDKAGAPYILHPLRLMFRQNSEAARIVAVLHDVVEDTPVTLEQLRDSGFAEEVVEAVDCLTHDPRDSYDEYIAKIKGNPIARIVKLADLEDNMRLERLSDPAEKDWERLRRYHRVWKELSVVRSPDGRTRNLTPYAP